MAYRKYKWALLVRVFILFLSLAGLAFAIDKLDYKDNTPIAVISIIPIIIVVVYFFTNLYKFNKRRFDEMDDFFESVKYRDFSRWYSEQSGAEDIKELHRGFNEVNKTIKEINQEKEAQHLYLQKILELIDTGIIAYNIESGDVLWVNDSFKKTLSIPSLKTVHFVEKRTPELYETVFENSYTKGDSITVHVDNENLKVLISSSIFLIEETTFKLIVLQNIDDTLNRTESEAWRKLLSVMTHEIMNSIAPISSLAETLQLKVQQSIEHPVDHQLEITDLEDGIESIKKRSEGLLKFAKTYRSLNKVTNLNLSRVLVSSLFGNIKTLMEPSLNNKNIKLHFDIDNSDTEIEMDSYLIEQVLINLILNAVEACKEKENPIINLSAFKNIGGHAVLKITDNGKGIPNEIKEEVFIPFFSTKKNGSGVGLSLCKEIMLLHKGKIQIKSKVELGTSISLIF
ncbi:sensor histidine kinase [Flavivirga eckloniae]|uniref:histidine kinase n=1 Tax=Flavivirga eckloniae TaxID=1803846 RepID=A0A2K9PNS8_9FLAO|nr:ATP-binding protein [Flavivirga eckloniae]AUP78478.1 ATP-binding protein [Flavivirga eckloniae]